MKRLLILLTMLSAFGGWAVPTAAAQEAEVPATEVKKKKVRTAGLSPVARALAEAGYFTESEARPKARFYIFICSASWCAPCRALMPKVVEEYEANIKKNKSVSLVLLGYDQDAASALRYIEHYETDMPGVLGSAVQLENRPEMKGIPWCFILNAKGELIHSGFGQTLLQWKDLIKNKPQKGGKNRR